MNNYLKFINWFCFPVLQQFFYLLCPIVDNLLVHLAEVSECVHGNSVRHKNHSVHIINPFLYLLEYFWIFRVQKQTSTAQSFHKCIWLEFIQAEYRKRITVQIALLTIKAVIHNHWQESLLHFSVFFGDFLNLV